MYHRLDLSDPVAVAGKVHICDEESWPDKGEGETEREGIEMGEVFFEITKFPLEKGVERGAVFLQIRELRWDFFFVGWEKSFLSGGSCDGRSVS